MTMSTYQMDRLLQRLRRWFAWPQGGGSGEIDKVVISGSGNRNRQDRSAGSGPARAASEVKETGQRHQSVEAELERRAGSFMKPPYPGSPPSSRIPRLKPPPREEE
ncbi:MAG: hypothetical protein OEZ59_04245 [Deltaproteobacteria bacterium]|nr:hypothetical protein [Deltaproteobacteria bacterium]